MGLNLKRYAKAIDEANKLRAELSARGMVCLPVAFDPPEGMEDTRRMSSAERLLISAGLPHLVVKAKTEVRIWAEMPKDDPGVCERVWVPAWAHGLNLAYLSPLPHEEHELHVARRCARDPSAANALLLVLSQVSSGEVDTDTLHAFLRTLHAEEDGVVRT